MSALSAACLNDVIFILVFRVRAISNKYVVRVVGFFWQKLHQLQTIVYAEANILRKCIEELQMAWAFVILTFFVFSKEKEFNLSPPSQAVQG